MFEDQSGRCAICEEFFEGPPHIDHCHETRKIRGLLCRACNAGLGMFKDDPVRLARAIGYLDG